MRWAASTKLFLAGLYYRRRFDMRTFKGSIDAEVGCQLFGSFLQIEPQELCGEVDHIAVLRTAEAMISPIHFQWKTSPLQGNAEQLLHTALPLAFSYQACRSYTKNRQGAHRWRSISHSHHWPWWSEERWYHPHHLPWSDRSHTSVQVEFPAP